MSQPNHFQQGLRHVLDKFDTGTFILVWSLLVREEAGQAGQAGGASGINAAKLLQIIFYAFLHLKSIFTFS